MNNKNIKLKTEEVNDKNDSGNGDKPLVPTKTQQFIQPASPVIQKQSDPAKERIATKIIEASGVKLQELNLIPQGLFIPLVLLDLYHYIQEHPDCDGEQISYFLQMSIYHHLRGVKAGLLNKVVQLANEEYKVQQQYSEGGLPGMTA